MELEMDFSIETNNLIRVLPHIYVEIMKFYFPNYHMSSWPNGVVHVRAGGRSGLESCSGPFFPDWTL